MGRSDNMGSIRETHLNYVKALRDRVKGYIKTQIPHKAAGSIFQDKDGKFGLFGDFGALHITGIEWCDSMCWYEWMISEPQEEKKSDEAYLGNATTQELLDED